VSLGPNTALRYRLLWLGALLMAFAPVVRADGFVVEEMQSRLQDGTYLLDARIDYRFSDAALEALDNGVPLHLEVQVQIQREGAWFWERALQDRKLSFVIRFLPLSELYLVADQQAGSRRSFATRGAAIDALGDLSGLILVGEDALDPAQRYIVRLRAALDIGALPLPLRPLAYLSPAWQLTSPWKAWHLQP